MLGINAWLVLLLDRLLVQLDLGSFFDEVSRGFRFSGGHFKQLSLIELIRFDFD